jgi:phosphoglycerate dehydrogenase-like enzyme
MTNEDNTRNLPSMPTSLTIWSNTLLPDLVQSRLEAGIGAHRLLVSPQRSGNLAASGGDPLLAEAEIAFGQPDPGQLLIPSKLKWVQLTSAGYTRYDREDLRAAFRDRKMILTNSSSVFDEPCAEHLVAFMLAGARAFPASFANQSGRGWVTDDIRGQCRLLAGQSGILLGFGAIARRVVELLQPFRMDLRALRRTPSGKESIPVYPITEMDTHLGAADHVLNILPASSSTERLIGRSQFARMKKGAIFYNIGRGTTIDQKALIDSLHSGHLAAAYLDVTDPEPLPADHPLWAARNCFITPHTAGGHVDEFDRVVDHFLANLRQYESNSTLRDRII